MKKKKTYRWDEFSKYSKKHDQSGLKTAEMQNSWIRLRKECELRKKIHEDTQFRIINVREFCYYRLILSSIEQLIQYDPLWKDKKKWQLEDCEPHKTIQERKKLCL